MSSLSSARSSGTARSVNSELFEQSAENLPIVDAQREIVDSQFHEQFVNHQTRFDIRHDRLGTDRIEVALDEFAIPPRLRVLTAPHRCDVVAFERSAELADVLCRETRKGTVKSNRKPTCRPP